nr:reverse transcriptase domain-containing protein [Tanacetum cinerariifolium]
MGTGQLGFRAWSSLALGVLESCNRPFSGRVVEGQVPDSRNRLLHEVDISKGGGNDYWRAAWMNFMIVKSLSPYNGIIGRPGLKAIQAVPSTVHGMLKFPTEGGIVTICSSLLIPAECASIGTSSGTPKEERTRPTNFTVALHPNFPDQEVVVGGSLSDRGRTELCALLKKNLDIFTWQPSDMTGVPQSVAEH